MIFQSKGWCTLVVFYITPTWNSKKRAHHQNLNHVRTNPRNECSSGRLGWKASNLLFRFGRRAGGWWLVESLKLTTWFVARLCKMLHSQASAKKKGLSPCHRFFQQIVSMCWFFIREMLRCKIIGLQKPWQTRIHTGHPASHQWAHACVFDLGAAHSASLQAFQDAIKIHVSLSTKTHTEPQNPLEFVHNKLFRNFCLLSSSFVGFFRRPSLAAISFLPAPLVHHQAMGVRGQDLRTCLCVVVVAALVVHHLQCHHFASSELGLPVFFGWKKSGDVCLKTTTSGSWQDIHDLLVHRPRCNPEIAKLSHTLR